jgi:hypothetical protein
MPIELEKMLLDLAGYAAFRARNYWWRSGNQQDLAKGMHLKDVVQEAVARVLQESRRFDANRGALLPYLKGVIDSIISNLADSIDNRSQRRFPEYGSSEPESIDRLRLMGLAIDPNEWFGETENQSVEARMSNEELSAPQIVALVQAIDDEELSTLFNAIREVGGKPADIAHYLGTSTVKVYTTVSGGFASSLFGSICQGAGLVKGRRDAEVIRSLELAFEAVPPRDTNEAHEELRAIGFDPVQYVMGLAQALRSNWATMTELGEQPTGGTKGQSVMTTSVDSAMTHYNFDDRKIRWFNLGDFKHFVFAMCDVDRERRLVDFMLKFEPNEQIFLHRHLALTNTLVVQGEHRLYEPNGRLKEIRQTGSYTSTPPGEPHREGGGSEGAVVFYSVRAGNGDVLFEVLDDDLKVVGLLSMADFIEELGEQRKS